MTASRVASSALFLRRVNPTWWFRSVVALSTLGAFLFFYDMYGYMPGHRGTLKALSMTFTGHFPLWLATLEIKTRLRFVIAILMIPSMIGAVLFWCGITLATIPAAATMCWFFVRVIQGKRFER